MNTFVTVVGNLTRDAELRFTQGGLAGCGLGLAVTPRRRNEQTGQWEDGQTSYYNVSIWGASAENEAESLHREHRVIVTGQLVERVYQRDDGETVRRHESVVDELGVSLRFATAKPEKARRAEQHTDSGGRRATVLDEGALRLYEPLPDDLVEEGDDHSE